MACSGQRDSGKLVPPPSLLSLLSFAAIPHLFHPPVFCYFILCGEAEAVGGDDDDNTDSVQCG